MQKIFPLLKNTKKEELKDIADELNNNLDFFQLNTPLRRCHFFAQIMQETGAYLSIEESFRYSYNGLIGTFLNFKNNKNLAKSLSYGDVKDKKTKRDGTPLTLENFREIANIAYGGRMENDDNNDGWKYRGRGLKQLTGKSNYTLFDEWHKKNNKYWNEDRHLSFLNNPDLLLKMKYATRSAAFFWVSNQLYLLADGGDKYSVSDSITNVINKYTKSKEARFNNFKKLYKNKVLT